MTKDLTKINPLETPKFTLENLKLSETVDIPSFQKNSINSTIIRIKDTSSKRYSVNKINDFAYAVKRIR
jgi:hypothetical protein